MEMNWAGAGFLSRSRSRTKVKATARHTARTNPPDMSFPSPRKAVSSPARIKLMGNKRSWCVCNRASVIMKSSIIQKEFDQRSQRSIRHQVEEVVPEEGSSWSVVSSQRDLALRSLAFGLRSLFIDHLEPKCACADYTTKNQSPKTKDQSPN